MSPAASTPAAFTSFTMMGCTLGPEMAWSECFVTASEEEVKTRTFRGTQDPGGLTPSQPHPQCVPEPGTLPQLVEEGVNV